MRTKHAFIYLFLFFILRGFNGNTQDTIPPAAAATRTASHAENPDELFSQFSLGSAISSDAYSVPKAALKTYKFTALIGKAEWDFNLYNSVPVVSISSADSEQYLRNDLLRQVGGLINISLGRTGYFANGKNTGMEEIKGGRFEFRLGAKALDVLKNESQDREIVPVLQSTVDFRYMIPLFPYEKGADKSTRTKDMVKGSLIFRFIGAAMGMLNSEVYDEYYSDRKGIPPNPAFLAGTFDINFFITNQLLINLGYSFTTEETIKPLPFFSISYGTSFH